METLVWVEAYQALSGGEPFAVGEDVTWPTSAQLDRAALTRLVGADTAAQVSMAVEWHALRPDDTADHTGNVSRIEAYRCRHVQGHVVPGTVEKYAVGEAGGWEPEQDRFDLVGYLVTLTNLRQEVGH